MVQRKAPDKPKPPTEHKKSHGRLERQLSSHLHQDTRTRGGADHKKKLKTVRSMKVSDFDTFEHSPMEIQFKKTSPCKKVSPTPIRNYMKPTSSSAARKGKLQVTITSPVNTDKMRSPRSSKNFCSPAGCASPTPVKMLSRQSSLKPVRSSMKKSSVVALCAKKNVNRATCSSTLKDSKFPTALELNHGATEAEGTSKMRVCPYTYCSLNGHMHEPLPPLKSFISARRKLLKAQRSLKIKGLLSFKTSLSQIEGQKIDEDRENEIGNTPSDLFVEIYTMTQEEPIGENNCGEISVQEGNDYEQYMLDEVEESRETMSQLNESSDISFEYDYDMDQSSEFSQDEMDDVMMNFLEFVEFDHERKTQEDYEEEGEIKNSVIETMDMDCEEEKGLFPYNSDGSDCSDDKFSVNTANSFTPFEAAEDDSESGKGNSHLIEKDDSIRSSNNDICELNFQFIYDEVQKPPQVVNVNSAAEMMNSQSDEKNLVDELNKPEKELQETSNGTVGNILNVSAIDYKEIDSILSSRWNIKRKKTTEEFGQVKEFNPRSPNFLPFEPDPDAEKVDLRHQMIDGRKNAEEWMIDYALQQAVTKLDPARKRKVALLVEAFETVIPLPMCEKPLSHGTSVFSHMSFIQACN